MKYILIFLALIIEYFILFIFVVAIWNPFYIDYGEGFYVSSDKEYGVDDLIYDNNFSDEKNSFFCFHDTLANIDTLYIFENPQIILSQHVCPAVSDDKFIILQRKPKCDFESIYFPAYRSDSLAYYGFSYDYDYSFQYLYRNVQYWIINKTSKNVYGPLSETQYYLYRNHLQIPNNLRLPFEDKWSNYRSYIDNLKILIILALPIILTTLIFLVYRKLQSYKQKQHL